MSVQQYLALYFLSSLEALSPNSRSFQNTIDTASYLSKQTGISLGVSFPDKSWSFATGLKDKSRGIQLGQTDKMGIGSATKTLTAAAVLKLVDDGSIRLDDVALPHMDVLIRRLTTRSLVDYLGPLARNVSVRHLLHMTSGINDYDSGKARKLLFQNPGVEFNLHEALGLGLLESSREQVALKQKVDATHLFDCLPGTCGAYSSTNYLLLGMLLAQHAGARHWQDYDQSSFLPPSVRQQMLSTVFPMTGRLRDFTTVHAYQPSIGNKASPLYKDGRIDATDLGVSGGFAVANALSTGGDMAVFLKALLGLDSKILAHKTRAEMMKLRWLETGLGNKVSTGQFYGMAVRDHSAQLIIHPIKAVLNPEIYCAGLLYGHDGACPAGYSSLHVYAPRYDTSISFIMNDMGAVGVWNFVARKVYDIARVMTPQVNEPLHATLENKAAFMKQPWIQRITSNITGY